MNNSQRSSVVSSRNRGAFQIALLYFLTGGLWILFSDRLAAQIAPNQAVLTTISIYKGWGFVFVTALMLYWLITRNNSKSKLAEELLQNAHDELELQVQLRTQALAQTNTLLETMLEYMPDQIYFKDANSRFIRNSRSQVLALGLSDSSEVIGKTDFDFFPHAQRAYDEEQGIIRSGQPLVDFEEWVVWPNGQTTWVSTTKVPLRDQTGQIIGTFGISRDITERKRNEVALRKAKDELEAKVAERTVELSMTNEQLQLELAERKQAEEKLRAGEERYRRFFENMHETFIVQEVVVDDAGKPIDLRYLDLNPAAERMLGKTHPEIVGLTRSQLSGRADLEGVEVASRVAATGTPAHLVRYAPGFGGWFESFTYSLGSGVVATLALDITERKQAEEAQHRSEERLNGIITSAMDAIISVDSEQSVVLFNAAAEKMFGYPASEAVGGSLDRFIPERFRNVHRAHISNFGETGVTNRAMNALGVILGRRASGDEFPIEASISQIEIDGKKLYTVILRDITERKRAESALRESEERLRLSLHAANQGLYDLNVQTGEAFVNREYAEMLGYDADSFVETNAAWIDRLHPDNREITAKAYTNYINGLTSEYRVEFRQRTKTGEWKWILSLGKVVEYDPDGRPLRMLGTHTDITERKQAEEALRQSQENFAKAFNSNPAAIAITRLVDGKFLNLNPAYTQIMEYEPRELLEHTAAEMNIYVYPEERAQLVQQLREQGAVQNYELAVRVKSGETRNIVVSMEPILYNQQECILSVFIDISERKKMELELRRSNAELEQFAYVASHDLQEPLRAVAGMVQLLQQRYQGKLDGRADEYIGHAVDASTRMQNLINDLLEFSRVERFGKPLAETDLESCLKNALTNLQVSIQESNAQITHAPLPVVRADAAQLTQVLQNLIGNAIKFRGERPLHIHIGAKKNGHNWQFEVSDNGIGIEPQYFERIFQVFQRLHTRREYPGTGIGLSLCKKIIERHGGQIWLESQPGAGAAFYFTLPERL